MEIDEIYTKLKAFCIDAIKDPSITILRANQNAPRQIKPFVTLAIGNIRSNGTPHYIKVDDNGVQELRQDIVLNITFSAYADQLHKSEIILNEIAFYLKTHLVGEHFRGECAYYRTLTGVSSIPSAVDSIMESRAILECEFGTSQIRYLDSGIIENVLVTDTLTGQEILINS